MNAPAPAQPESTLSPIDALLSRVSVSPRMLTDPGPTDAQIDLILDAALRAPDHGNLKPARFILIRGEARQRFADLAVAALHQREPNPPEALIEKFRSWPRTVPVIVAVAANVRADHKIPEIEQILSAGAAAMNILNAAHALGFAAMWVTGPNAYDPVVLRGLGLAERDKLVGFVGIGTPTNNVRPVLRKVDRQAFVSEW